MIAMFQSELKLALTMGETGQEERRDVAHQRIYVQSYEVNVAILLSSLYRHHM